MIKAKLCELCNNEASLYCAADSAFLCKNCDTKVHQANFLVSRHIRQILCTKCKRVTTNSISNTGSHPLHPLCHSCSPNMNITISNSSTSSDCVSTTESSAKRKLKKMTCTSSSSLTQVSSEVVTPKVDAKAEGIFVIWCRRLGLNGTLVVPLACDALGLCLERLVAVLPFRACLAASFWLGLRLSEDRSVATWQNLKRLEVVSGVPAKLIAAVEVKLARQLRVRRARHDDMEEGWAES